MKDRFNCFALRYLAVLVLGLGALALHRWSGALRVFLPVSAAPWEWGKLGFWPMLAAIPLTGRLTGGVGKAAGELLPSAVATAAALFFTAWGLSLAGAGRAGYLFCWVAFTAAGTAWSVFRRGRPARSWALLAAALAAAYVLFACLPPVWYPFLDPRSAAAMARIPC